MKHLRFFFSVVLLACASTVSVGQVTVADFSEKLRKTESDIAEVAEQVRIELEKSDRDPGTLDKLNEDLKKAVTGAFQLRQLIQKHKILKARNDLLAVEKRFKQRSADANKIVAHRIEELTDTRFSWSNPHTPSIPNRDRYAPVRGRIIRMFVDLTAPITIHKQPRLLHITTADFDDCDAVYGAIASSSNGELDIEMKKVSNELFVRGPDDAIKHLTDAFMTVESNVRGDATKETMSLVAEAKDNLMQQLLEKHEKLSEFLRNTPADETAIKRIQDRIVEYESRVSKQQLELVSLDVKLTKVNDLLRAGKADIAKSLLTQSLQAQFDLNGATDTEVKLAMESMVAQQETLKSEISAYDKLAAQEKEKLRELQVYVAQEESLRNDLERTQRLFDSVVARLEEINLMQDAEKRIIWVD